MSECHCRNLDVVMPKKSVKPCGNLAVHIKHFLQGNMMKGYVWVLLLAMTSMECVAGFDEGITSYEAQDYQSALREFLPLANGGNASAQFYLGLMYYSGAGVPQNYSQAAVWYRKAADQGDRKSVV